MKYTDNFQLDLYEYGDNANLMDGFNHAMQVIDAQLLANRTDISQLNTRMANIEASYTRLLSQFEELLAKMGDLSTKVATLEVQYASLNEQTQAINGNLVTNVAQTTANKTAIDGLETDYSDLDKRVKVLEAKG